MEKKRHSELTSSQVRDRLVLRFFTSIIITGLILGYASLNRAKSENIEKPQEIEKIDENLQNNKPVERWRLNSNGFSQKYVILNGTTVSERSIDILNQYNLSGEELRGHLVTISGIYDVHPEFFICIMYADTSLGRFMKSKNNPGNVGNNDRGDVINFGSFVKGVDAIGRYALNGSYLKNKYTVDYLSPAFGKPGPYYATSPENWHVNVMNCLGMIHNKYMPDNRKFRF